MTAIGVVIAVTAVANAEAVPSLPPRTAAQLLAEVAQAAAKPLGPLSATVQQTANLGLPQLPAAVQPGGGSNLLAGTRSISIWYLNPQHIRLALPVQAGESDLRLNGRTLWLWSSASQTATKVELPAEGMRNHGGNAVAPPTGPAAVPGAIGNSLPGSPLAAAKQVLAAIGPSTAVSVQRNVYVAGRAAYQLSIVPRSSDSLVGQVLIAIDASLHIPLRVQVFARGSSSLAYGIGFSSLSFGPPAAANFSFTPPPGATVRTVRLPGSASAVLGSSALPLAGLGDLGAPGLIGGPAIQLGEPAVRVGTPAIGKRLSPALPRQILKRIIAQFAKTLPKGMSVARRAAAIKAFEKHLMVGSGPTASNGGGFVNLKLPTAQAGAPKVIGTGWLSVIATPPDPVVAAVVRQLVAGQPGGESVLGPAGSSSVAVSGSGPVSSSMVITPLSAGPVGPGLAALRALLKASTPVHGSWGSGRLLQTTLLSVLITSDGRILAGAVTPAVLYADVALDAG